MTVQFETREAWLKAAEAHMAKWIEIEGYEYPLNTRVSCGFPKSSKGRNNAIGQCWSKEASGDSHFEMFIHPQYNDALTVCGILIHEMCHATVGIEAGHGKVFGKLARAIGLEGKLTATTVGAELAELIADMETKIGAYPHGKLTSMDGYKKPKSGKTYLIKCQCDDCGYIAYSTAKWIDEQGTPHCPDHGSMRDTVREPDE